MIFSSVMAKWVKEPLFSTEALEAWAMFMFNNREMIDISVQFIGKGVIADIILILTQDRLFYQFSEIMQGY